MSASTDLNIDHVARLARLTLTAEEASSYSQQLGDVLHHIDQLAKVDVGNVEPTAHAFPICNVWDEDEPRPGLLVELALRNAPQQRENMVVVPKIME